MIDAVITCHEDDLFILNSAQSIEQATEMFITLLCELAPQLMLTKNGVSSWRGAPQLLHSVNHLRERDAMHRKYSPDSVETNTTAHSLSFNWI
jgi:hypothetical protein